MIQRTTGLYQTNSTTRLSNHCSFMNYEPPSRTSARRARDERREIE